MSFIIPKKPSGKKLARQQFILGVLVGVMFAYVLTSSLLWS